MAVMAALVAWAAPSAASVNSRPSPTARASASTNLDGERFSAGSAVLTPNPGCGLQQAGIVSFSASGTATGPFPGTFTETGQWDFDLIWEQTFQTNFTITSGGRTLTGSISYDNTASGPGGTSLVNNWGGCGYSNAGGAYSTCANQQLKGACAGQSVAFIYPDSFDQVFEHPTGTFHMSITGGDHQAAPVSSPGFTSEFAQPLTVSVTDGLGAPVAGVTVRFIPAKRNPTASPQGPWTTTAWDGSASMNMFPSPVAGTYTVTAKGTKGASAVFTLTNTP